MDFYPGSPNDTRPNRQRQLLPQKIQRDLRVSINYKRCFKGCVLKSASLHKPKAAFSQQNEDCILNNSGSCFKVHVLTQTEGCVSSSKLKRTGLRPLHQFRVTSLNNSELYPPSESESRLSAIQSYILQTIQSRVS